MTGSIALFIPHSTKKTSEKWFQGLITLKPRLVIWINSFTEPFVHLSIPHVNPFHPPFLSSFPLLLQTSVPPSILPFLHLFILLSLKVSFCLSKFNKISLSLVFITPCSLCFHLSISRLAQEGCICNWDLLKMSFLTDGMRHSTALLIYPSSALK